MVRLNDVQLMSAARDSLTALPAVKCSAGNMSQHKPYSEQSFNIQLLQPLSEEAGSSLPVSSKEGKMIAAAEGVLGRGAVQHRVGVLTTGTHILTTGGRTNFFPTPELQLRWHSAPPYHSKMQALAKKRSMVTSSWVDPSVNASRTLSTWRCQQPFAKQRGRQ